jgi:DNA-binding transcriptional LysR family regulator
MIRGIECLLSLEETHHFGAAAQRLGISQSALSQSIAQLERDLDARLVLRGRAFEGFTPAGEAVVSQGRKVMRAIGDLRTMVERCRPGAAQRFVIGIIPITTFVAPLLSSLILAHHPSTSLAVEVGDVHFVARGIRERRLDAGIVYLVPELLRDMVQYPLYEERYCLVSPAGSDPRSGRPIAWRDAACVPMAMLTPAMLNRKLIDEVFAAQGLKPLLRLESDSILSLITHVEQGVCSAILPRSCLAMLPAGVPLGVRPLVDPVVRHPVGLVMLREKAGSAWRGELDALFGSEAFARMFAGLGGAAVQDPPACD